MIIPYQYNKMAAGATVSDPNRAIAGSRGVFTYLRNGSCNQSCMVMENRHLASSKISRMEVLSDGSALYTTVGSYANISVRSGGTAVSTVVNYGGYMMVSSGGTALNTELNSSGSMYLSPGATASGGEVHSYGRVYAYSNTEVNDFHVSYGGGLYGQGTSVTFNSITVSSGADFNAGSILINFFKTSDNVGLEETFEFCKISLYLELPSAIAIKHSLALFNLVISSFRKPSASGNNLALLPITKLIIFSFTLNLSSIN